MQIISKLEIIVDKFIEEELKNKFYYPSVKNDIKKIRTKTIKHKILEYIILNKPIEEDYIKNIYGNWKKELSTTSNTVVVKQCMDCNAKCHLSLKEWENLKDKKEYFCDECK